MATISKVKPAPSSKSPDFIIRARQAPRRNKDGGYEENEYFATIGAAWAIEVDGKPAYSIRITSVPLMWDGSAMLLVPRAEEE